MAKQSHLPLVLFLYTSQYLGIGFLYFGLNGILRANGVDLESLAALSALGIIWVAKALWAPLIDRFAPLRGGHYRGWLLIMQPLVAVTLLALLPYSEPHKALNAVVVLIGLYILVSATQDIATDAIVARYISAENQGWANATAVIGSWLGNVFGGGGVLMMYDNFGWQPAIVTLAALALLPLILVWRFQEPETQPERSLLERYRNMGVIFRLPYRGRWMLAAHSTFFLAGVGAYGLITPALVDAGWSLTKVGLVMGLFMAIPASIGAATAGWAVRRVGLPRLFIGSGICLVLASTVLAVALSASTPDSLRLLGLGLYILAMSGLSTGVYTIHMAFSRPEFAGTDFTTLTCIGTLWSTIGSYVALTLAAYTNYQTTVMAFGGLCLVGGFVAAAIARNADRDGQLRHSGGGSREEVPTPS